MNAKWKPREDRGLDWGRPASKRREARGGSGPPLPVLELLLTEAGREVEGKRFLKEERELGTSPPSAPFPHQVPEPGTGPPSHACGPGMTLQARDRPPTGPDVCSALGPDHSATARPTPGRSSQATAWELPPQQTEGRRLCWAKPEPSLSRHWPHGLWEWAEKPASLDSGPGGRGRLGAS